MADELPGAAEPSGAWKHDWHPYEDYQVVHYKRMRDLENEGIVIHHGLTFTEIKSGRRLIQVHIEGRIECVNDLHILVDKWLEVKQNRQGHHEVRGHSYSYNAWLRDGRQVLRYDSAHGLEELHHHTFQPNGEERLEIIELTNLPTLDRVIVEAVEASQRFHQIR